jgi:hypothetical protein
VITALLAKALDAGVEAEPLDRVPDWYKGAGRADPPVCGAGR